MNAIQPAASASEGPRPGADDMIFSAGSAD